MHRASHTDISTVSAIAMPRLPLNLSSKIYNGPGMCLAVTNVDGTIKLLHRYQRIIENNFFYIYSVRFKMVTQWYNLV